MRHCLVAVPGALAVLLLSGCTLEHETSFELPPNVERYQQDLVNLGSFTVADFVAAPPVGVADPNTTGPGSFQTSRWTFAADGAATIPAAGAPNTHTILHSTTDVLTSAKQTFYMGVLVTNPADDDYIGVALGMSPGVAQGTGSPPVNDQQYYLIHWKAADQAGPNFAGSLSTATPQGNATAGLYSAHIGTSTPGTGIPSLDEFWGRFNSTVAGAPGVYTPRDAGRTTDYRTINGGQFCMGLQATQTSVKLFVNGTEPGGGGTPDIDDSTTTAAYTQGRWGIVATAQAGVTMRAAPYLCPADVDKDTIGDVVDIDDDNDGILDVDENTLGLDPTADNDNDSIPNWTDKTDRGDGMASGCPDVDVPGGNGICDTPSVEYDTDQDGVPNHYDLDSDNDGISDLDESGLGGFDADNDDMLSGTDANGNGLVDAVEAGGTEGVVRPANHDTDDDGVLDAYDLDSDGDGLDDIDEDVSNSGLDADNDGAIDSTTDIDGDGIMDVADSDTEQRGFSSATPTTPDSIDGDGVPDTYDPDHTVGSDSDGDGETDAEECPAGWPPCPDSDGDGTPDYNDPTANRTLLASLCADERAITWTTSDETDVWAFQIVNDAGDVLGTVASRGAGLGATYSEALPGVGRYSLREISASGSRDLGSLETSETSCPVHQRALATHKRAELDPLFTDVEVPKGPARDVAKILVRREGLQLVPWSKLDLGTNSTERVRVSPTRQGAPVPHWATNDGVVFFAPRPSAVGGIDSYWIAAGRGRPGALAASGPRRVTHHLARATREVIEVDTITSTALAASPGADVRFWTSVGAAPTSVSFDAGAFVGPVTLSASFAVPSAPVAVDIELDGRFVGSTRLTAGRPSWSSPPLQVGSGAHTLRFVSISGDAIAYLDHLVLGGEAQVAARPAGMRFTATPLGSIAVPATAWAIDLTRMRRIQTEEGVLSVDERTEVWTQSSLHAPRVLEALAPVAIERVDHVIIAPAALMEGARALADHRRRDGLSVTVAPAEALYDAYTDGLPDARAFARYLGVVRPRYAVLVGDGQLPQLGTGAADLPTLPALTGHGLFGADGDLGDVDGDGRGDIAVGRLPFSTSEEIVQFIERMHRFETATAARSVLVAAGPEDDAGSFVADAGRWLARFVTDATTFIEGDDARARLQASWQDSPTFVHYMGHGGAQQWGNPAWLSPALVAASPAPASGAITLASTCTGARFDLPGHRLMGESLLDHGWSVAVVGPTYLSHHASNVAFGAALAAHMDTAERLGDATLAAGHGGLQRWERAGLQLLGDPAMRMPRR